MLDEMIARAEFCYITHERRLWWFSWRREVHYCYSLLVLLLSFVWSFHEDPYTLPFHLCSKTWCFNGKELCSNCTLPKGTESLQEIVCIARDCIWGYLGCLNCFSAGEWMLDLESNAKDIIDWDFRFGQVRLMTIQISDCDWKVTTALVDNSFDGGKERLICRQKRPTGAIYHPVKDLTTYPYLGSDHWGCW